MNKTQNLGGIQDKNDDTTSYFLSLDLLRTNHLDLLKRYRKSGNISEFLGEIKEFIRCGRTTGALLEDEDDRWNAQSLLDYWISLLSHAGFEPLDATLVDFDPDLVSKGLSDGINYQAPTPKGELLSIRCFFPYLKYYKESSPERLKKELLIVTGAGIDHKLPEVKFPTPGAVMRALNYLTWLAYEKVEFLADQVITIHADRDLSKYQMDRTYVCTIASPAVNEYTRTLLDDIMNKTIGEDHIAFLIDNYPKQPVRLSFDKELINDEEIEKLHNDTYEFSGNKVIFRPLITPDKKSGVDYGLFIRRVAKKDEIPQAQFIIAGCKNYGTWAAYHAATNADLLNNILKKLKLKPADLESELSFWVLLKGQAHDWILTPNDVTILSCDVLKSRENRTSE